LQLRQGPVGSIILDDSYNANRVSVLAGLATLSDIAAPQHRLAILGDMYELGDHAETEHRAVGVAAAQAADRLIAFGSMARWIADAAAEAGMPPDRITCIAAPGDAAFRAESMPPPDVAASRRALAAQVRRELAPGDVVLVKAARGMRLDYLVELLAGEHLAE
jgi:UDP-N-acetylmuramoyl-tripeptide--D-alanyl-D-alanine ligase